MSNQQSLQRILTSPAANKYATVGKFLASRTPAVETVVKQTAVSADEELGLLDNLVEQALLNRQITEQPDQVQPALASARAKEMLSRASDQTTSVEVNSAKNEAESAPNQEVVPNSEMQELSKELQEVSKETKEQREQAMIKEKQQAINDLAAASTTPVAVDNQPVVVLPITAASKEEAKFKTTAYSVKWLWEWCKKIGKIFAGAVVYKEEVEEA